MAVTNIKIIIFIIFMDEYIITIENQTTYDLKMVYTPTYFAELDLDATIELTGGNGNITVPYIYFKNAIDFIFSWRNANPSDKQITPEIAPKMFNIPEFGMHRTPEVEREVEPEPDPEIKPEVEPKPDPEIEPEVEREVEPEVEPEPDPEIEPEVEPEVEREVGPKLKTESPTLELKKELIKIRIKRNANSIINELKDIIIQILYLKKMNLMPKELNVQQINNRSVIISEMEEYNDNIKDKILKIMPVPLPNTKTERNIKRLNETILWI